MAVAGGGGRTRTSRCSRSDENISLLSVTFDRRQLETSTANCSPSAGVAVQSVVCACRGRE